MTLSHYSATSFIFDPTRTYVQEKEHFKPLGLWLSVDGDRDWPEWCKAEDFNEPGLRHRTEMVLAPDANILHLKSADNIRYFTQQYAGLKWGSDRVNWAQVAKDYQGIIIAPYQWECRLDHYTFWYYTWDCASGCVWDLSVIRVLETV